MPNPDFQLDRLRELIAVMRESGVSELSVELPDLKISLKREASAREASELLGIEEVAASGAGTGTGLYPVVAPMVGIFRAASGESARVSPGDSVSAGQIIGAIEAMKVPNDIPSPVGGVVREVLAADGAAVEYGQPLMLIEPQGAIEGVEVEAEAI